MDIWTIILLITLQITYKIVLKKGLKMCWKKIKSLTGSLFCLSAGNNSNSSDREIKIGEEIRTRHVRNLVPNLSDILIN